MQKPICEDTGHRSTVLTGVRFSFGQARGCRFFGLKTTANGRSPFLFERTGHNKHISRNICGNADEVLRLYLAEHDQSYSASEPARLDAFV